MINCFEETSLKNESLPEEWRSQGSLDELDEFLQRNWEQRFVYYDDREISSRQQFISFIGKKGIRTNNYIGTVVYKGKQLNIFPKVFRSNKKDNDTSKLEMSHLMRNIAVWIEYCTKFEYPFINVKTVLDDVSDLRDLFFNLFVHYTKTTLERGLFYRYEDKTEDCGTIKGKINFRDYIANKLPNGKANICQCTYSNFEFDNLLNRIIKAACKILLADSSGSNQKILRNILIRLNDVSDISCTPSDCDKIRLSYLNGNYRTVLSMCKIILLNKNTSYNIDTDESFCFLFPTELLFEGFVGGFMQSILKGKAHVRLQASELSLISDIVCNGVSYGEAFTLKHDILVEYETKGVFVLDTKYKTVSRFSENPDLKKSIITEISQSDLYQIREYAAKRGIHDAYLLYPLFRWEGDDPMNPVLIGSIKMDNRQYDINVHIIRLPFIFEEDDVSIKNRLAGIIDSIFN